MAGKNLLCVGGGHDGCRVTIADGAMTCVMADPPPRVRDWKPLTSTPYEAEVALTSNTTTYRVVKLWEAGNVLELLISPDIEDCGVLHALVKGYKGSAVDAVT